MKNERSGGQPYMGSEDLGGWPVAQLSPHHHAMCRTRTGLFMNRIMRSGIEKVVIRLEWV